MSLSCLSLFYKPNQYLQMFKSITPNLRKKLLPTCMALIGLLTSNCKNQSSDFYSFELLKTEITNIDFNNKIVESKDFYPLNFIYIYNGGGVGVLDVNNDGLADIYFAGNDVNSKLYLNKGNLQFEDITQSAGLDDVFWATGVSVVDINDDGYMDLYVCAADRKGTPAGKNRLYINNGDNTFTDKAKAYGLADEGYSTQAAFFDYDNDGDLDAYILTNAIEDFNHNNIRPRKKDGTGKSTDRLYQNNGDGTFTNVSEQAGITIEGYGLGIGILDVNQDGWDDIYCSNDFITADLLWINNGDGTFTDKISDYVTHTSYNGMGLDISDYDNDGGLDIIQVDMLPESNYHHKTMTPAMDYNHHNMRLKLGYIPQYVRNTLQKSNSSGQYSEIGRLLEIHKTDWSWAPLFIDFNNNGFKDLFISNGYGRDVTDLDYATYSAQESLNPFGTPQAKAQRQYEGFDKIPPIKLPNYFYSNKSPLDFQEITTRIQNNEASISNGASYADLDNDGDLDIITNNMNGPAFIYKNLNQENRANSSNYLTVMLHQNGVNQNAIGAEIQIYHNGKTQSQHQRPVRGYASSVDYRLHFGLGKDSIIDSLIVIWPDKKLERFLITKANQNLLIPKGKGSWTTKIASKPEVYFEHSELSSVCHKENTFNDFLDNPLYLKMLSREGPSLAVADINNDGRDDFIQGSAFQDTTWIRLQGKEGSFDDKIALPNSWFYEDAGIAIFDLNNDGLLDVYVGSGGNEFEPQSSSYADRIYFQKLDGHFEMDANFKGGTESTGPVCIADIDGDGDLDLFVGSRLTPNAYPLAGSSKLLVNEKGTLIDKTKENTQGFDELGMVTSAIWTDFNNDTAPDLLVVGEWMAPKLFVNTNGKLVFQKHYNLEKEGKGLWNSLLSLDIDNDGDFDYIIGNLGLNSDMKASTEEPITLLAKDFDNNGAIDPILGHYTMGNEYPYPTRDALASQISAMKKRFPSYKSYAEANFDQLFTHEEKSDALKLEVTQLATSVLINENGKFTLKPLPYIAQLAPVYGIITGDFNNDTYPDLLLIGNRQDTETLSGFLDSNRGVVLLGDRKGFFASSHYKSTPIWQTAKNARSIVHITQNKESLFVVGNNDAASDLLKPKQYSGRFIKKQPNDILVTFLNENGSRTYKELFSHQGYWSQNSSHIAVPDDVFKIEIINSKGQNRSVGVPHP